MATAADTAMGVAVVCQLSLTGTAGAATAATTAKAATTGTSHRTR